MLEIIWKPTGLQVQVVINICWTSKRGIYYVPRMEINTKIAIWALDHWNIEN